MAPFRIGVLITPPIQLLDISPIDLFAMATQEYFRACNLPQALVDTAIPDSDMSIAYISHVGADSTSPTTARLGLRIDSSLEDPNVAPGKLNVLMIPGPPPGQRPPDEVLQFVRAHVDKGAELMTICTGVWVAGFAGVLDGRTVTGPRGLQDVLAKDFPKVKWVDKRYVCDGKIWSSGGITNGMDLVGWYMQQRFGPVAETVLALADVQVRGQEYGEGKAAFTAWFVWHIFKAWVRGLLKTKKA